MKYWRGYICAALFAALTWALTGFAEAHGTLMDAIYPYASRLIMTSLAGWSAGADFCLWQLLAVLLAVLLLASIVAMIVLRWNFFQWLGWVLACVCLGSCLNTAVYGLNYYAGDLSTDIRLEEADATVTELAEATTYFLDIANELSTQVPRNTDGSVSYPEFSELAAMAADGFTNLTHEQYLSVFAGSTLSVKELGWAEHYTQKGVTGMTVALTGEASVNPQTPAAAMPYVMCREMCHRMCIAYERDANLGAFLACDANSSPIFRYSGYMMAFRFCYNALVDVGTSTAKVAANEIYNQIGDQMMQDLCSYGEFFTKLNTRANDDELIRIDDNSGVESNSQVADLLVSWYLQEIYLPAHQEEVIIFDPTDRNQVDLSENPYDGE